METTIKTLNMLSAVVMLTAGAYIQMTFETMLSLMVQSVVGVMTLVFFFLQMDMCLRKVPSVTKGE